MITFKQKLLYIYIKTKFTILSFLSPRLAAAKAFKLFSTPIFKAKVVLSEQFQEAQHLQFTFKGYVIRGYRFNHPQSKKLLIVHGFQSHASKFDHFIEPFTNKGYEVLAFDAPGHGHSSGKRLNALLYKEMIQHIEQLYGPMDVFLTHSLGGLASSLALEECSNSQQKLILIAPVTETTSAIKMLFQLLPLPIKVQQEFEHVVRRNGGKPSTWYSVSRILPKLHCHVLWVHDENDFITPFEDAKKVFDKQLPHIQHVITQKLGHRRVYHDKQVLKKIKEFLEV